MHYFMNGCFLGGKSGEENRDNNYLLEHVGAIAQLPIRIVQGEHDEVCPPYQADDLVETLKAYSAHDMQYELTNAGHSMFERENALALTRMMDELPAI
jgi:proline iminopeptidase